MGFVMKNLIQIYETMIERYGENNFLGIFALGKINYGFEPDKEIKVIGIYLPTFAELCTNKPMQEEVKIELNDYIFNIYLADIRLIYHIEVEKDTEALELLFCNSKIINPKYENIFNKYFLDKRETIARYNPKLRLQKAYDRAAAAIERKDTFEAVRLMLSSKLYVDGAPCDECFHLTKLDDIVLLQDCIDNNDISRTDNVLSMIQADIDKCQDEPSIIVSADIKEGVITLIDNSLKMNISTDSFIDTLTNREKDALKIILNELDNGEGTLSISSLLPGSNLSRPVFNNVLQKIKENHMGEVVNKGAKGMYIKFANIANLEKELK